MLLQYGADPRSLAEDGQAAAHVRYYTLLYRAMAACSMMFALGFYFAVEGKYCIRKQTYLYLFSLLVI